MKRRVLPYDILYLERRLPVFIVLLLRYRACEIPLPRADPMLTRSKYG